MKFLLNSTARVFFIFLVIISCNQNNRAPTKDSISQLNLKRGDVISCGATGSQFGSVDFETTCNAKSKKDLVLALEMLHSFEYDESEKVFAKVIDETPDCAMAYWGVAMSNFHPLWTEPTEAELQKGSKAIEIAKTISNKSARESAFINAIATFYIDWENTSHCSRCINYEKAMETVYATYPQDKEAAVFYALALDASADPKDETYSNQKKAGALLNALYPSAPNHPGIIHYIIHSYDYPGLAELALPFARKYASVAPSSAHALHMPSHTFTRLGLWDECIKSNLASVSAAKCYAEQAGIQGHWDEELHGMDYLVYAYLQKGANDLANGQLQYLQSIREVHPVNFKVAYAFAAIPARLLLENKDWTGAAKLEVTPANFLWNQYPWQESIIHFTRLLGSAHLGNVSAANFELKKLNLLKEELDKQKDNYKSKQVAIQIKAGEAWLAWAKGKHADAMELMKVAAAMEDSTSKHPVTPGEVLPARELLGDILMQENQYGNALLAYENVLRNRPNRFNSLYGAGLAAVKLHQQEKAVSYFQQLLSITDTEKVVRAEITEARKYLSSAL